MFKKTILLLIITIALVVLSYILIKLPKFESNQYVSKQSSVMWPVITEAESSWITFTDPSKSVSLKHPPEWERNGVILYLFPECKECGGVRNYLSLKVISNDGNLTSSNYTEKYISQKYPGSYFAVDEDKPPFLKKYDVTMVAGIFGAGSPGPNFYITHNGKVIMIESDGVPIEILSKILSSLVIN